MSQARGVANMTEVDAGNMRTMVNEKTRLDGRLLHNTPQHVTSFALSAEVPVESAFQSENVEDLF